MIYKSKDTGELVTKATMLKTMHEQFNNPEPDELAIMEHFLLVLENWDMGQMVITRALDAAIKENPDAQRELIECFGRYKMYDWGDSNGHDQELNDRAIINKDDRILASYYLKSLNKEIWIITEWDRSVTTFLFPEDY